MTVFKVSARSPCGSLPFPFVPPVIMDDDTSTKKSTERLLSSLTHFWRATAESELIAVVSSSAFAMGEASPRTVQITPICKRNKRTRFIDAPTKTRIRASQRIRHQSPLPKPSTVAASGWIYAQGYLCGEPLRFVGTRLCRLEPELHRIPSQRCS